MYNCVYSTTILNLAHCMSVWYVTNSWSYNYISKVLSYFPQGTYPLSVSDMCHWFVEVYHRFVFKSRWAWLALRMSTYNGNHELQHVYTRGSDPNSPNVAIRLGSLPPSALRIHSTIRLEASYFKLWWHPRSFAMTAGIQICRYSSEYWYA